MELPGARPIMIVDPSGSQASVTGAIRHAARLTGADFQYLLATAQVESNLNPGARVSTSSARGLFQFIDQTWLATLKEEGPALGYGPYADAITRLPSGHYAVADPRMVDRILNLRSDPTANATMAGAFTRSNAATLAARLGREASEGELYIAHFLGSGGAARLIDLAESRPMTPAAQVFPGAARANPSIFFARDSRARTVGEVYRLLVGRYQVARGGQQSAPPAMAKADNKSRTAFAPDPAALAQTYETAARLSSPKRADDGPVFHQLFHTGGRRGAVAPVVSALWSSPASQSGSPRAERGTTAEARGTTLDLFQDQTPNPRALFRGPV
jgi:hypothetical protein